MAKIQPGHKTHLAAYTRAASANQSLTLIRQPLPRTGVALSAALRSTSIIRFANHLLTHGNETWVKQHLWPVLRLDLGYVADSWNLTGFDLWAVSASSFFTTAAQHRSLREGNTLATALDDPDKTVAEWTTQADNALCFLQSYWNSERGYIISNANGGNVIRSGLDSTMILGSIHTFDPGSSPKFSQSSSQ